jgi:hypothetical protein
MALNASPNPLNINGLGAPSALTESVTETGYSGLFGESDTCSGIATVSTANAHGPSATYTVTGVTAGMCNITFSDASSQQQIVAVTVTASGFIINKKK